jgi:hypothetical protein
MRLVSIRRRHCQCLTRCSKLEGQQSRNSPYENISSLAWYLRYLPRRNLWQSLYVMDCFLATSLGRPNHISCETASELCSTQSQSSSRPASSAGNDLSFAVNASKIVGKILSRVYDKRKASRSIAYQLSLCFSDWSQKLPPDLHWRVSFFQNQDHTLTLKRLHINLICFHGIIILRALSSFIRSVDRLPSWRKTQ